MDLTKQIAQTNEGMLKEAERIFDEFAKTLKKQVVSSPTKILSLIGKSKFKEFASLVKRMREAQKRQEYVDVSLDREGIYECRKLTKQREKEVDEYLKKMEE